MVTVIHFIMEIYSSKPLFTAAMYPLLSCPPLTSLPLSSPLLSCPLLILFPSLSPFLPPPYSSFLFLLLLFSSQIPPFPSSSFSLLRQGRMYTMLALMYGVSKLSMIELLLLFPPLECSAGC